MPMSIQKFMAFMVTRPPDHHNFAVLPGLDQDRASSFTVYDFGVVALKRILGTWISTRASGVMEGSNIEGFRVIGPFYGLVKMDRGVDHTAFRGHTKEGAPLGWNTFDLPHRPSSVRSGIRSTWFLHSIPLLGILRPDDPINLPKGFRFKRRPSRLSPSRRTPPPVV